MGPYTITIKRKPIKKTFTKIGLYIFPFDSQRIRHQEKDKKCHVCGILFEEHEYISLAFLESHKNHLLCEGCAKMLVDKGVPYVGRGENNWEDK